MTELPVCSSQEFNEQYLSSNTNEELTPLIFNEFAVCCDSEYVISEKESDSAISSDGEFIDAGKIRVYQEDDERINEIENERGFIRDSIYRGMDRQYSQSVQRPCVNPLVRMNHQPKTKRDKGLRFFNQVGYTHNSLKYIPRWATNTEILHRMVRFQ